jgi:hypothetical protein
MKRLAGPVRQLGFHEGVHEIKKTAEEAERVAEGRGRNTTQKRTDGENSRVEFDPARSHLEPKLSTVSEEGPSS